MKMKSLNMSTGYEALMSCQECELHTYCLDTVMVEFSSEDQISITKQLIPVKYKEVLVKQGQLQKTLFIVRSGAFKATRMLRTGREKVARFYFPGDFIGLAAFNTQTFLYSIESCQPNSSVCQLALEDFFNFFDRYPKFRKYILQLFSTQLREYLEDDSFVSAETRLARFFLMLQRKSSQESHKEILELALPRKDIANHLGMAIETLSRILTRWSHLGMISLINKKIILIKLEAFSELAEFDLNQRVYPS